MSVREHGRTLRDGVAVVKWADEPSIPEFVITLELKRLSRIPISIDEGATDPFFAFCAPSFA
jgi:hypothetical protein